MQENVALSLHDDNEESLTLEALVETEMRRKGIDPTNPDEVENYWDEVLHGEPNREEDEYAFPNSLQAHLSMQRNLFSFVERSA